MQRISNLFSTFIGDVLNAFGTTTSIAAGRDPYQGIFNLVLWALLGGGIVYFILARIKVTKKIVAKVI